jgi:hypothetical protein
VPAKDLEGGEVGLDDGLLIVQFDWPFADGSRNHDIAHYIREQVFLYMLLICQVVPQPHYY